MNAPNLGGRHYEGEEFPSRCDHCPRELSPGARYRRAQIVLDLEPSTVGGVPFAVEGSHELVLCEVCSLVLSGWVSNPIDTVLPSEVPPGELDDSEGALTAALERELYVLSHDPAVRAPTPSPRVAIHPPPDETITVSPVRRSLELRRESLLLRPPGVPDVAEFEVSGELDALGDLGEEFGDDDYDARDSR